MRKLLIAIMAASVLSPLGDAGLAREKRRAPAAVQNPDGRDIGYFSNYLTGPGGMKTPIRDYPGSATVITRKMMDDFQARSVCDALRLAPGVVVSGC